MANLPYPQMQPFQIPSGGGSRFDPSVGAQAQMEAARLIVNPFQRALEQRMAAQLQERAMQQEMVFRSDLASREMQERKLLQQMEDRAALQRVEAQIAAQQEERAMQQARADAQSMAMAQLLAPALGAMGPSSGAVVAPGTGPMSVEMLAQMPGGYPSVTPDQAVSLGAGGLGEVARFRSAERERSQTNAEQEQKRRAEQAEAEAQRGAARTWRSQVHSDNRLSPEDKLAVLADFDVDPKSALGRYEALVAKKSEATAKAAELEASGRVEVDILGDRRKVTKNLRVLPGEQKYTSKMPDDAKAELWGWAEQEVRKYAQNDPLMQAALFDPTKRSEMIRSKAYEGARSLGWNADDEAALTPSAEFMQTSEAEQGPYDPETDKALEKHLLTLKTQGVTDPDALGKAIDAYTSGVLLGADDLLPIIPERRADREETVTRILGRGESSTDRRTIKDTGPEDALLKAASSGKPERYTRALKEYREKYGEPPEDVRRRIRVILTPYERPASGETKAQFLIDRVK